MVNEAEVKILERLTNEPVHIDELVKLSGLPTGVVLGSLAMMELRGTAKQTGGLHFTKGSKPAPDRTAEALENLVTEIVDNDGVSYEEALQILRAALDKIS